MEKFLSIICLNGILPAQDFFKKYQHLPILAADGAGDKLIQINIQPAYIIGDFDSSNLLKNKQVTTAKLIRRTDQNYTDFEKLIIEAEKLQLFPALICGIFGGEADHILNNIRCFLRYSQMHKLYFYDQAKDVSGKILNKWGQAMIASKISKQLEFTAEAGELVSIIAYEDTIISANGLKWPLGRKHLSLSPTSLADQSVSQSLIRNKTVGGTVQIILHKGIIILITSEAIFK